MYAIEVSNAVKKYKNGVQALNQLSLSVFPAGHCRLTAGYEVGEL